MITADITIKTAEMAKLRLDSAELCSAERELCRMAEFAKEISDVADSIDIPLTAPDKNERAENRDSCEMDVSSLPHCGMHIKDGFFRIKAGERK